jgi:hypothetical protein
MFWYNSETWTSITFGHVGLQLKWEAYTGTKVDVFTCRKFGRLQQLMRNYTHNVFAWWIYEVVPHSLTNKSMCECCRNTIIPEFAGNMLYTLLQQINDRSKTRVGNTCKVVSWNADEGTVETTSAEQWYASRFAIEFKHRRIQIERETGPLPEKICVVESQKSWRYLISQIHR